MHTPQEVQIVVTPANDYHGSSGSSRRNTGDRKELTDFFVSSRRQSLAVRRVSNPFGAQRRYMLELLQGTTGSIRSLNTQVTAIKENHLANQQRMRNRKLGNDALSIALSALYAKLIVILGVAFPVSDILTETSRSVPASFYQGFYLYLYLGSIGFVSFMFIAHLRTRAVFSIINDIQKSGERKQSLGIRPPAARYGSFYLRVGAISFGIGSMVYSGLEFGQYFELKEDERCHNYLIAVNPVVRMILTIFTMQFIFLNSKQFEMFRHRVIARFGLMHMVATNLCEWLYVLVEETKHEIVHLAHHSNDHNSSLNSTEEIHEMHKRATAQEIIVECRRTNIMGSLVQNASPFLFPCTIEYSLICAVILFEMWKKIKPAQQNLSRRSSMKPQLVVKKNADQLSLDCSSAHRGMFAGILVIVLTIICLIMFFVLNEQPSLKTKAVLEVTISEILLYVVTIIAVIAALFKMQDLKFSKPRKSGIGLDCTLLLLAQVGVFIYCLFSIMGCFFALSDEKFKNENSGYGFTAEMFSLIQTSLQTLFILNAWWRRSKGALQNRKKPGREIITFLLVANMAMWFINTLIKNRASFRITHLHFFGVWGFTIITHISMPLAIFYRFHSTICLFEIWKTAYKNKG